MSFLSITALALVGLGSAGFVAVRDERAVLGAFLVQWLGLVCASVELDTAGATNVFGLGRVGAVELVTVITCGLVTGLTLRSLRAGQGRTQQPRSRAKTQALRMTPQVSRLMFHASRLAPPDYLLPGAVVLLGGAAGVGFASLFPLATPTSDLVFYWAAMAGVLTLVLDGARSIFKLTMGLLVLLNALVLLVYGLSIAPPSTALLGLMAASRLGMVVIVAYGWLLNSRYKNLNLGPLFTIRDDEQLLLLAPQTQPQVQAQTSNIAQGKVKGKDKKSKHKNKKGRRRNE